MGSTIIFGIIILAGFLLGELAEWLKLPKITGYIIAGIILKPAFTWIDPAGQTPDSRIITDIALSFITFSIGGTLLRSRIKKLGKTIVSITFLAAELPFLFVFLGLLLTCPFFITQECSAWTVTLVPFALLMGALASPTDPTAPLAVVHEYGAKGDVTTTILGIAALDDVLAIVNFSIAFAVAEVLLQSSTASTLSLLIHPIYAIFGALVLGIVFGVVFNYITPLMGRETEGALIVLILGMLIVCFGVASHFDMEAMLSTMAMGAVVVNFCPAQEKIFRMLDRYVDELVFVLFFTLSGMFLDFYVFFQSILLIAFYVLLRAGGKILGVSLGARITGASAAIRKYTAGGLLPQGGIVIGMALLIRENPAFEPFSGALIGIILGATVIHELAGPVIARVSLRKAGEIEQPLPSHPDRGT